MAAEGRGQIPGSKSILRYFYSLKVAEGTTPFLTTIGDLDILVDTIETSTHSFYQASIIPLGQDGIFDIWQTSGVVNQSTNVAAGVNCAILKRRTLISPDTVDVFLHISSTIPDIQLDYKVYRMVGLD